MHTPPVHTPPVQTRAARLLQLALYALAGSVAAGLLSLLFGWATFHRLDQGVISTAFGWGGFGLMFLAGAIISAQASLGITEATLRGRLGDTYRPPPLPLAPVLTAALGSGLLFLAQALLRP